jgi:PAS domain S-box-containing protein
MSLRDRPTSPLSRLPLPAPYGYAAAIALTLIAAWVRLHLGPSYVFLTFFPAIALAAWAGGIGPGLLAVAISGVLANHFMPPHVHRGIDDINQSTAFLIFLLIGLTLVGLTHLLHRARMAAELAFVRYRQQELLSQVTLASIGDGVIVTDAAGNVTFLNAVAESLTGWSTADAVGRPLTEVFHLVSDAPGDPPQPPADAAPRTPAAAGLTLLISRDGRRIPVDASRSPIRPTGATGDVPAGVVFVFRNAAERRETEARFRTLADSAPVLIWMAGADARCHWFNKPWLEFTGRTLDQEDGDGWTDGVHPDDLRRRLATYEKAFAARQPFKAEYRLRRNDGAYRWLVDHGTPLFSTAGEFTGYVGSCVDIHDQKREQARLTDALERSRRQQALVRAIIDTAPIPIGVVDCPDYRFVLINPTALGGPGVSPDAVLGKTIGEVAGPVGHLARDVLDDVRHTRRPALNRPATLPGPDGAPRHYLTNHVPLLGSDGAVSAIVFVHLDVTDMKRIQDELRSNQQRLELAQRAGGTGAFSWDLTTDRVYWSPECEALYGMAPGTFAGRHEDARRPVHPDDYPRVQADVRRAIASAGELDTEYRIVWPDGSVRWLAARGRVVTDDSGRAVRMIGVNSDVTARRRAATELAENEERLRLVMLAGRLGAWDWDVRANKIAWTDRVYEIHGVRPGEFDGSLEAFLRIVHADDRDRVTIEIRRALAEGTLYDIEFRVVWPSDGSVHWLTTAGRAFYDERGHPTRMVCATTEITERKLAEQDRERLLSSERHARSEAENANRLKDEFLATLSHELRTPLNAILGWAHLLRATAAAATAAPKPPPAADGEPNDDLRQGLEIIERNARAQSELIEDLLDMSRIASGKLRLKVQPVDIAAVIRAAVDAIKPAADARRIRLRTAVAADLPPVSGDRSRLQQVVWNLLSNAVKFTPEGKKIMVRAFSAEHGVEGGGGSKERRSDTDPRARSALSDSSYVVLHPTSLVIEVSDTGHGIEPAFLPYVFDRFRQGDASTTRLQGGIGLGLAIVRHLVELHGGTVTASSPGPDLGATFTVRLPALLPSPATPAIGPDPAPPAPAPAGAAANDAPRPRSISHLLEGLKVLVVDDEPDARQLIRKVLEQHRAAVTTAGSVSDALAAYRHDKPNLVISDIGMPGEDGYALIRKIRQLESHGRPTPAVALTAFVRTEDRRRILHSGFHYHLPKPFEAAELLAVVSSLAGRR